MSRVPRVAAVVAVALVAAGWIPEPDRIANAIAKANREAGRAGTIELLVELRFEGDPEAAARGSLVSDPAGRARLELVSPRGFVERHLLAQGRLRAARNGIPLEDARTFLPPYWLFQTSSGAGLRRWLTELGTDAGRVDLGYQGAADCYVLGGREPGSEAARRGRGALWIHQESLAPVRLDLPDGTRFDFGPLVPAADSEAAADAEAVGPRVPAWIEVEARGEPPARLIVTGAAPVTVQAGGFGPSWLHETPAAPAPHP